MLRLLSSPHQRLLIADEVGLGKTIEAGLIWTELEARNAGMRRVLVVCPAMLVQKWCDEMRRRFDRELTVLDKSGLDQLVTMLQTGDEDKRLFGVVSLERLRSTKVLADLNDLQPRFDLVIVDEAHYLRNSSTVSHHLGRLLSDWAEALLFLSATPLNLGNDDLFNLLNLLVDDEFSDRSVFPRQVAPNRHLNAVAGRLLEQAKSPQTLVPLLDRVAGCEFGHGVTGRVEFHRLRALLNRETPLEWREVAEAKRLLAEMNSLSSVLTRTRKVDVPGNKAVREPLQIDVAWTDAERACYRAVLAWARRRCATNGGIPGFSTQMPLRQAASCLPVMRDRLREGDASLFSGDAGSDDLDDVDLWSDEDDDQPLRLDQIRRAVDDLGEVDTKFDRFVERLAQVRRLGGGQVLVFSFFCRTLAYLERRLRDQGCRVRSMHGGVPVRDRQHLIDEFRAKRFDVLLTSEVGSEGLDFEFCNTVVNYDVPWNPMKLEQRIGRLDRFGQEHDKIFILNFHVPGTIETDMFGRLYNRINVFRESIGELEPILRDELNEVQRIALDPTLDDRQRQRRMDEKAVAFESRQAELEELREESAQLAGIDQLLIDGFVEDTRSRGRFVGSAELRILLEEFFADGTRAALRESRTNGHIELIGDDELAGRVSRSGSSGTGSVYRLAELVPKLRDEEPLPVTFDNEEASRRSVDLISLRHPVVRAAVNHFDKLPHGLKRFGSVRVTALAGRADRYLVVLYLATTTGLRPSLELWPVSIDLASGAVDDAVGFSLLSAVANGTLEDGGPVEPHAMMPYLEAIERHAHHLQCRTEDERRRENEGMVDRRIATQTASYEGKISRAEATLAQVVRERRSASLQRLHRGRINNLSLRRDELIAKLEEGRQLAVTLHPVAVAVVSR